MSRGGFSGPLLKFQKVDLGCRGTHASGSLSVAHSTRFQGVASIFGGQRSHAERLYIDRKNQMLRARDLNLPRPGSISRARNPDVATKWTFQPRFDPAIM